MSQSPLRVLLVEDYRPHAELIRRMLIGGPGVLWQVEVVPTLHDALRAVAQGCPDVVLLDLKLPDSDGINTFTAMAAAGSFPIVVLTGTDDEALAMNTVKQGAQDYLVKSRVEPHGLERTLRYAIERARIQRELAEARDGLERRIAERTAELQQANAQLREEIEQRKQIESAFRKANEQLASALTRLQHSQQELVQRERLLALGRMARGIAHELNNALSPIVGFSELLLEEKGLIEDRDRVRHYLEMIHQAGGQAAQLVRHLRAFHPQQDSEVRLEEVSLNAVVNQVVNLTRPFWHDEMQRKGIVIRVERHLDKELPHIVGDAAALREMLTNLFMNAVEAVAKEGCVRLATRIEGRQVVLEVADDGVGMTAAVAARCFEPFFTTKPGSGTGHGMGIAYSIVQQHHGDITLRTAPGQGTTVRASFPLPFGRPAVKSPPAVPAIMKSRRILVVEDEPLVCELITTYLAQDDHAVETAGNGQEGLEKFRAGTFDLVITDRAMPGMNGDQLAVAIKRESPGTPIMLLTGYGDQMGGAHEKPAGIDLVISKPFNMATLRAAIARLLNP